MKRLFWVSLILSIVLSSCASSADALKDEAKTAGRTREETLSSLQKAYAAAPEDKNVSYNWAYALASDGRYAESLEVSSHAVSLHPDTVRFYTLRAFTEKSLGLYREYEKTLESLLVLDEAYTAVALELMLHYEALFEHEKAEEKARLVLKYEKDNEEAISVLSRTDPLYRLLSPEEVDKVPYRKRNELPAEPPIRNLSDLELLPLTDR
ncbi:MAG: hypothetical protein ACI4NM_09510 [Bullifex sp.]